MQNREGSDPDSNPYREVCLTFLAALVFAVLCALAGGLLLRNPVMFAVALTASLAAGIFIDVLNVRRAAQSLPVAEEPSSEAKRTDEAGGSWDIAGAPARAKVPLLVSRINRNVVLGWKRLRGLDLRRGTAATGWFAMALLLLLNISVDRPSLLVTELATGFCLFAAGLAVVASRYLASIDPTDFPESTGLCRGARVMAWVLLLAAVSVVLAWANLQTAVRLIFFIALMIDAAVCYGLYRMKRPASSRESAAPLEIGVLSLLGKRLNIVASVLDTAEQQLGIDLRSTWALTIVRRSIEPLAILLCLAGWLSTSVTIVGMDEEGLIERLGVPLHTHALEPGLHLHLPWPFDQVFRIPVQHVQTVQVGHEGDEAEGPENVLWAVEHAPNEYTLLLGNGRDLITVDAAVQYKVVDSWAWRYHCQNPAAALKAIAYRAVMRSTVNLTLSDALSQNVAVLSGKMRAMVQKEADDLGLGVEILGFTVGGMHPPVPVASAYEAVVSAELGKVTSTVDAQVFRNQTVPAAESAVVVGENNARAEGARTLALASGQAWSFRALEAQYHAAPGEYLFRRRLESMEKVLPERRYTVVDSRFLRAGGEIWMTR